MAVALQLLAGSSSTLGVSTTWNPATKSANITLTNGNLTSANTVANGCAVATVSKVTGKWYFEVTITGGSVHIGLMNSSDAPSGFSYLGEGNAVGWANNGNVWAAAGVITSAPTYTIGDRIGIAYDGGTGIMTGYKNGVSVGALNSGMNGQTWFPSVGINVASAHGTANFGNTIFPSGVPSGYNYGWF